MSFVQTCRHGIRTPWLSEQVCITLGVTRQAFIYSSSQVENRALSIWLAEAGVAHRFRFVTQWLFGGTYEEGLSRTSATS